MLKTTLRSKVLKIFRHDFLYTAYADATTLFHKDRKSLIELMNKLNTSSNFLGLKPNKTKCETAGIGVLNGVQVALCGIKCVNLNNETVKIIGVHIIKILTKIKTFEKILLKQKTF